MNILVCIKQVPDTTEVRLRADFTLERDFVAQVMNPADESALEWALRTRERTGGTVTVVSMGPPRAENMLRETIARGADRAALLTDPRFAGADTLVTARCLKSAAEFLAPVDVIACGRRAVDGETGQVGPMLASMLDWPCLYNLVSAEAGAALRGRQLTETAEREWECPYPAVLTFCEWSYRLRLPTLRGLRNARTAEIRRLTPDDLGIPPDMCGLRGSPTRVVHVDAQPVGVRPCRKMTAGEAMAAAAERCPEVFL